MHFALVFTCSYMFFAPPPPRWGEIICLLSFYMFFNALTCIGQFLHFLHVLTCFNTFGEKKWSPDFRGIFKHLGELHSLVKTEHVTDWVLRKRQRRGAVRSEDARAGYARSSIGKEEKGASKRRTLKRQRAAQAEAKRQHAQKAACTRRRPHSVCPRTMALGSASRPQAPSMPR